MLQIIVWALLNGCAFAGLYCDLNSDSTACLNATQSQCTDKCLLYKSQAGCMSVTGCKWSNSTYYGGCSTTNSSNDCFYNYADADCTANSACVWQTLPCKLGYDCNSNSSSYCLSAASAAECTSQGSYCVWTPRCSSSTTCGVPSTQTDCTGVSGCFWSTVNSSDGASFSVCNSCFSDISNITNDYLAATRDLNKECGLSSFGSSTTSTITSAVSASTGCAGGVATSLDQGVSCGARSSSCTLNSDSTNCAKTTQSECTDKCSLYKSQAGCMSMKSCNWTVINFFGMDGGSCSTTSSSGDPCYYNDVEDGCTADPACVWQTVPCKFEYSCKVKGSGTCNSAASAAQCTSQGSQCAWTPTCEESTTCEMPSTQTDCTGTSGCFWSSGTANGGPSGGPTGGCKACFTDISNTTNDYLAAKRDLNQKCTASIFFMTVSYTLTSAVPASTGCVGGAATPPTPGVTCGAGAASVMSAIALTIGSAFVLF